MHGLGFAGGLSDAGLPAGHIPTVLLFFSAGVETGHLLFIGVVLSSIAPVRRVRILFPLWADVVPPYAIGTMACSGSSNAPFRFERSERPDQ